MKLIVLAGAQTELFATRDYYLDHANLRVAASFLNAFDQATKRVLEFPDIGTRVSPRLRTLPLWRFPYSLIYQQTSEAIIIVAVASQRRRPGYWRARLTKGV